MLKSIKKQQQKLIFIQSRPLKRCQKKLCHHFCVHANYDSKKIGKTIQHTQSGIHKNVKRLCYVMSCQVYQIIEARQGSNKLTIKSKLMKNQCAMNGGKVKEYICYFRQLSSGIRIICFSLLLLLCSCIYADCWNLLFYDTVFEDGRQDQMQIRK